MIAQPAPAFVDVQGILEPCSIAVIGASDQLGNLGGETVRRLLKFNYPGRVFPISRTAKTVAGLPCSANVSELPGAPDLAILAIPANGLMAAIRESADFGVRHGIAYAGGLAEAGGEGVELQRALVALCREKGFVLCGPNCVGVINATTPVAATFSTALQEIDALRPGPISMVCQSGGIATTAFSMVQQAGFGFRHLVSSGNEAVVDFADYLYAFAQDAGTRIIGGYLEGIASGPKFVLALEEARTRGKPVVLIKAGTTGVTARAALAHTGALVGEDRVVDAILKEMGVLRVHSVEELVDVVLLLAGNEGKGASGSGVGVITFGGGNGVLGADQCTHLGLSTPALSPGCIDRLRPLLVSVATAANPLDLTPTTAFRPEAMAQLPAALDIVAAETEIQSLLFVVGSMAAKAAEISEVICGLAARAEKPVCASWPSPPRAVPALLAERGVYSFLDPGRGIRALSKLVEHGAAARRPARQTARAITAFDWQSFVSVEDTHAIVPEHVCHRILTAAGLAVAAGKLADNEAAAVRVANAIGLPVVLKGIASRITHRAKAGLVALDLRSEAEVGAAFRRLEARAAELSATLDGVYAQKLYPPGTELLVTAFRDPMFGVMVSCGSGGILTELIDDVVTERAPVGPELAAHMLERLRTRRQATDSAGLLPTEPAARFVARFSELALTAPWERFVFEANPVLWRRNEAVAVDGLLVVG
jgi:acetyltransferase